MTDNQKTLEKLMLDHIGDLMKESPYDAGNVPALAQALIELWKLPECASVEVSLDADSLIRRMTQLCASAERAAERAADASKRQEDLRRRGCISCLRGE